VTELVRSHAAAVLGHATSAGAPADQPFRELGVDSLTAVELRDAISAATGVRLPATAVFDFPTPRQLAQHLRDQLVGSGTSAEEAVFHDLDRLEAGLAAGIDADARAQAVVRLRALLSRATGDDGPATDRFDAATDDELFDLVDRDLGLPGVKG
jgi:acyl carrier protein